MLRVLAVEGYRSLHRVVLPLAPLTVVTGANGTGKTSLYRVLRLLAATSRGGAVAALSGEGGLPSVLWAGPETLTEAVRRGEHPVEGTVRRGPVAVRVGFAGDEYGYAVDFGLPAPDGLPTLFSHDPQIKREAVWSGPVLRPASLLTERRGQAVHWRDADDRWVDSGRRLAPQDSVLSEVADARTAPEVLAVREQVRSWRFYDAFRTDAAAPARSSCPGTFTPVMADDGSDLPSALQTIDELGHGAAVADAVEQAFPGSRVQVVPTDDGHLGVRLRQHGLLRPLSAGELSDGTLRYLLWVAALLTPRPPRLFVLNEPETSLHPDLVPALGRLVARAAERTQTVVVTHSEALRRAVADAGGSVGATDVELVKDTGRTVVAGQGRLDEPPWHWPGR
ncbi:AAA family ATPase [Aquipuribacter sp. MA13-6]|uniref:AAA family ATPase n=1 Tax=unclassified Aquipuribacter TaxID=2635084 RepID=UPI003EEB2B0D